MTADARAQVVQEIQRRLGRTRLLWVGVRGPDAWSSLDLPQFEGAYSIVAPLLAPSAHTDISYEALRRERVDLDAFDLSLETSPEAAEFRRALWGDLGRPAWVVPYRATSLLSGPRLDDPGAVSVLGMSAELQAPFERKAWVEASLEARGVRIVPWRYYRADQLPILERRVAHGPLVVRRERSSGGAGLAVIDRPEDLAAWRPSHPDESLAAAPYLSTALPLNVGGCVGADGSVSIHTPSVQLIGIPGQTRRRFGYCGNDFARAARLPPDVLAEMEVVVRRSGEWLASCGWRGAFGLDILLHEGRLFVTEVNPRFQGSTALSCRVEAEASAPDIVHHHLAAFLGLRLPPQEPLAERAPHQAHLAQVYAHNVSSRALRPAMAVAPPSKVEISLVPSHEISVLPNAVLFRAVFRAEITNDGYSLGAAEAAALDRVTTFLYGDGVAAGGTNETRLPAPEPKARGL